MKFIPFPMITLVLLSLTGCDSIESLSADLDPKTEPTQLYLSEFQGLDYRARPELDQLRQTLNAHKKSHDLEGMATTMISIGDKYIALADQVVRISANNVDEDATAYVENFSARIREIGELHREAGTAARQSDAAKMESLKPELSQMQTTLDQLQSKREQLFETLSSRYGGKTFNTVDYY